jgi:hypothetical protein
VDPTDRSACSHGRSALAVRRLESETAPRGERRLRPPLPGLRSARRISDPQAVGRVTIAAAVTAVVALLAPLTANAAPTRAQFIQRGDALCRQVQGQLVPLRRQAAAAKSLPEAQKWEAVTSLWTAQINIQARFNARFRALGVPARDPAARSIVSGLDRGLVLARRVRDAFAARATAALADALPAYLRSTLSLNGRVAAYGFRVCGRS